LPYIWPIIIKIEISRLVLAKPPTLFFLDHQSIEWRTVSCGRTDSHNRRS